MDLNFCNGLFYSDLTVITDSGNVEGKAVWSSRYFVLKIQLRFKTVAQWKNYISNLSLSRRVMYISNLSLSRLKSDERITKL
jgi:hypothetical protein